MVPLIKIDPEFKAIMDTAPLTDEQLKGLEASLIESQLLDPLIVWDTGKERILIEKILDAPMEDTKNKIYPKFLNSDDLSEGLLRKITKRTIYYARARIAKDDQLAKKHFQSLRGMLIR